MKLCILTLFLLLISNSSELKAQSDQMQISGEFTGFADGEKLYLFVRDGNARRRVDSCQIENGRFQMAYFLSVTPSQIRLSPKGSRARLEFWSDNESIEIKGDKEGFAKSTIIKSRFQADELAFREAYDRSQAISVQLKVIMDHLEAPSAVHHLNRIRKEVPLAVLDSLYQILESQWSEHDYGRQIYYHLQAANQVAKIGEPAIDFTAKDEFGQPFRLSDHLGDKHVLVEFRSNYCPYSVKAIPEIQSLHKEFSTQLQIVTFAIDTKERAWQDFLKKGDQPWIRIWDGLGEVGPVGTHYGITGSPYYFIISPEGIVQDTWVGYTKGDILERWLAIKD